MHQDQGDFEYFMETDGEGNQISNKLKEIVSNSTGHTYLDYDKNGNLVKEEEFKGSKVEGSKVQGSKVEKNYKKEYFWDFENRLLSVIIEKDDKTFEVSFMYNDPHRCNGEG